MIFPPIQTLMEAATRQDASVWGYLNILQGNLQSWILGERTDLECDKHKRITSHLISQDLKPSKHPWNMPKQVRIVTLE